MSDRIDMFALILGEVIPALQAAGWSDQRIRVWRDTVMERMSEGAPMFDWIAAMAAVVVESGDERATYAVTLALEEATRQIPA